MQSPENGTSQRDCISALSVCLLKQKKNISAKTQHPLGEWIKRKKILYSTNPSMGIYGHRSWRDSYAVQSSGFNSRTRARAVPQ